MPGSKPRRSPLDAFADTAGPDVVQALKALGNETRLAILLGLWEAEDEPTASTDIAPGSLAFSDLHERVGVRDSGQFTYHLNQLVGTFVDRDDDGYHLNPGVRPVLGALLSGWFRRGAAFEAEPLDGSCPFCGGSMVADFQDGMLVERCTSCRGGQDDPELPVGTVSWGYRPPAGLEGRTPREFIEATGILYQHQCETFVEGVCPACGGRVEVAATVCDDHDATPGKPCPRCGNMDAGLWTFTCDVCRMVLRTPAHFPAVYTDPDVLAFFHDHGVDARRVRGTDDARVYRRALQATRVLREDPLRLQLVFDLGGDRLEVTMDERARVMDVQ